MKEIIELCARYEHRNISVDALRVGLIHALNRADSKDIDVIAQLILKAWENEQ
jgi:thiamine biosynthesis protein ThiC